MNKEATLIRTFNFNQDVQLWSGCSTSRFHGSENEDAGWGEEEEERQGGRKGWSEKTLIKIQNGCSSFGEEHLLVEPKN